jgi:tetratricopeptide (TPR) repeat protein
LKGAPRPLFLWVHFYDPHAPYDPAPAFLAKFPGRPYDAEIAAADFGVATILDALTPERRRETLTIVTGDHGESLGEHGESEHGVLVYDSTLHVPLVVAGAGVAAGAVVRRQVRHVDLMPTIAELAGASVPAGVDGVSLARPLRGERETGDAPASYAESRFGELHFGWSPLRSLRDGTWKYIESPEPELYQVAADRGEQNNRREARADTASAMAGVLANLARQSPKAGASTTTAQADAAERLRTLGYVGGRVDLSAPRADGHNARDRMHAPPVPKREIARYEAYVAAFNRAGGALENGQVRDAEARFRRLVHDFPAAFEAHQYLARALSARHASGDAVGELDTAIQLSPRESPLYFDEARILADEGQFDRAFDRVGEGRRLDAASFYGALTEGLVARAAGQDDRAERALREAIQMNPTLALAHFELGALAERRGDRDGARREYQLAIDGDATLVAARRALERLSR